MKGEESYLAELLQGWKTRFVIPVYQRNYDWRVDQCRQLFDDLEDVARNDTESHFFGSIVSKADGSARMVIDGQQRITTSFLLLLALVQQIRNGTVEYTDNLLVEKIVEGFLIDKFNESDRKLKLKLIKDDQAAFEAIYEGDESKFIQGSNITQNYHYFCNRIAESNLSADELEDAIEKLMIIDIKLDHDDDAQRIFESLNSTGLDLTEGDKIRNFILMGLDPEEQELYYEKYWNAIEKNTGFNVSAFIRYWIAANRRKLPSTRKVYTVFKDYIKAQDYDTQELLEELLRYSEHYKAISTAHSGNEALDQVLRRLSLLNMTVMYPYSLNLFEYRYRGEIDDDSVIESLCAIESYLFRRWVCRVPTNALDNVFETLHGEALRGVKEGGAYPNVLKKILLTKEGASRFPNDKEFMEGFTQRDFYHIPDRKYHYYLFNRLENRDNRERIDVIGGLDSGVYSIEHIMPQTLSNSWKADLGENAEEIHDRWLNSMANLTLTAYNSKYSNRRFAEKRDMKDGFKDSGFRLNKFVSEQDKWGEEELKKRDKIMQRDFKKFWPAITSDFEWSNDAYEEHALDDDFDFTGRKIAAYNFMGSQFAVKTWAEMICGVLSMVYERNPVIFQKYLPADAEFPGHYFSRKSDGRNFKVGRGIYFNFGSSTDVKIETLKIVFDDADIDYTELLFELYKNKDDADSDGELQLENPLE